MRIIDADALKANIFDYASPEMLWDRRDIEHKIDEMPTVKVIPFEWLEQKYAENDPDSGNEDFDRYLWDSICYVLTVWKEEKGECNEEV